MRKVLFTFLSLILIVIFGIIFGTSLMIYSTGQRIRNKDINMELYRIYTYNDDILYKKNHIIYDKNGKFVQISRY